MQMQVSTLAVTLTAKIDRLKETYRVRWILIRILLSMDEICRDYVRESVCSWIFMFWNGEWATGESNGWYADGWARKPYISPWIAEFWPKFNLHGKSLLIYQFCLSMEILHDYVRCWKSVGHDLHPGIERKIRTEWNLCVHLCNKEVKLFYTFPTGLYK